AAAGRLVAQPAAAAAGAGRAGATALGATARRRPRDPGDADAGGAAVPGDRLPVGHRRGGGPQAPRPGTLAAAPGPGRGGLHGVTAMTEHLTADRAGVESQVAEAADDYLARLGRGERPDVEEYAERYPAIADALRQVLPALRLI